MDVSMFDIILTDESIILEDPKINQSKNNLSSIKNVKGRNINIIADIKPDSRILVNCTNSFENITTRLKHFMNNIKGIEYRFDCINGIIKFNELDKLILPSLEYLHISGGGAGSHALYYNNSSGININNLPQTLKHLDITIISLKMNFNPLLDNLPSNLETLVITAPNFNQSVDNLPSSLKHLSINSREFNQSLDYLPPGLEKFFMGKEASFGKTEFNQSLDNIPNSIKEIELNDSKHIKVNKLPISLEYIRVSYSGYSYRNELQQLIDELNTIRNNPANIAKIDFYA
jgi:hypothetical protein